MDTDTSRTALPPVGTRVTRDLYMDDGTWSRKGDGCLPGPQRHGVVTNLYSSKSQLFGWWDTLIEVLWDDGITRTYLPHGVVEEAT